MRGDPRRAARILRRAAAVLALCAAAFLPACGPGVPETITPGRLLPAIPVIDMEGSAGDLREHCDGRPTLVTFWGTWCQSCRKEIPLLNALIDEYGERGFGVLGVSMGEPLGVVKATAPGLGIGYPVVIASDTFGLAEAGIETVPDMILVDREGRVVVHHDHVDDKLRASLDGLMAGGGLIAPADRPASRAGFLGPPSTWLTSPVFWAIFLGMSALFYWSLIVIHCCAHDNLTRWSWLNRGLGEALSLANVFPFEDFKALHYLHHSRTNRGGEDPHHVRPGEKWLVYVLTHYFRLIAFTFTPYYRENCWQDYWKDRDLDDPSVRRRDLFGKLIVRSGRRHHNIAYSLLSSWVGYLALSIGISLAIGGPTGPLYLLAFWYGPWAVGQILVADFNFRGHVGLPHRGEIRPYAGQDTRSYYDGFWRFMNAVTFGFYHHREHHIRPSACLFAKESREVRTGQEKQGIAVGFFGGGRQEQ